MVFICLSTTLSLSCSSFQTSRGSVGPTVDPEIRMSQALEQQPVHPTVQAKLDATVARSWQVILQVLEQSGYSIQKADPTTGKIHTLDRQFMGTSYPWRESYSIQVSASSKAQTIVKVRRWVKVYRRILLLGPTVWMSRPSNGQREKKLIELFVLRLDEGEPD